MSDSQNDKQKIIVNQQPFKQFIESWEKEFGVNITNFSVEKGIDKEDYRRQLLFFTKVLSCKMDSYSYEFLKRLYESGLDVDNDFRNYQEHYIFRLQENRKSRDDQYQYGNAGDILLVKYLEKFLDSNEKGMLMETKENINLLNSKRNIVGLYDVVGKIIDEDYVSLIRMMRAGICDDIGTISSASLEDTRDIIRYKDREYGEIIRKYHLTKRGFQMNIICFWDED